MKGSFRRSERDAKPLLAQYERAKTAFDMPAAVDIVSRVANPRTLDLIVDRLIETNLPPIIVVPHPEYDSGEPDDPGADLPRNALPFAYSAYLAADFGCEVDEAIFEINRPGRTKLSLFPRFLWQPAFAGSVRADRAYILADDVCTLGGTLAMLRSYIVEHGGTVIAATALANASGENQDFKIAEGTLRVLKSQFSDAIQDLLIEEVGHGCECLTETEGQALVRWGEEQCSDCGTGASSLQRLRTRLAQAAEKAS